jgi:hypothetical protein
VFVEKELFSRYGYDGSVVFGEGEEDAPAVFQVGFAALVECVGLYLFRSGGEEGRGFVSRGTMRFVWKGPGEPVLIMCGTGLRFES